MQGIVFPLRKKISHAAAYLLGPERDLTGLGVHAVLDLGGRLRFGPDTEYVDEINYTVDENRRDAFYAPAAETFPDLDKDAFMPDWREFAEADGPPRQSPGLRDSR